MTRNSTADLQALVEKTCSKKPIPSVVLGIRPNGSSDTQTFVAGHADADLSQPMTPDTPYFLASVTKMYTTAVVVHLDENRHLDLDGSIADYLSQDLIAGIHTVGGSDRTNEITVRHLLTQTSGLADYFEDAPPSGTSLVEELQHNRDRSLSLGEILTIVRTLEPLFPPGSDGGTRAHYSDTNFALLGAIIEQVTGSELPSVFRRLVFDPLELDNTFVFDSTTDQPDVAAFFYRDRPVNVPLAMSSFVADGGIVATVDDCLTFLAAFFDGSLFERQRLTELMTPWNRIVFPLRYGHGLMKFQLPRFMSPLRPPPELIGHSGATGSFAFRDSSTSTLIAGTVNQMDRPNRPYQLVLKALRSL